MLLQTTSQCEHANMCNYNDEVRNGEICAKKRYKILPEDEIDKNLLCCFDEEEQCYEEVKERFDLLKRTKSFIASLHPSDWVEVTIYDFGSIIGKVKSIDSGKMVIEEYVVSEQCYARQCSYSDAIAGIDFSVDFQSIYSIASSSQASRDIYDYERKFEKIAILKKRIGLGVGEIKLSCIDIRLSQDCCGDYGKYFTYFEDNNKRIYILTAEEKEPYDRIVAQNENYRIACIDKNPLPFMAYNTEDTIVDNGYYLIQVNIA